MCDSRWIRSLWSSASGIVRIRPPRWMLLAVRQVLELCLYEWEVVCVHKRVCLLGCVRQRACLQRSRLSASGLPNESGLLLRFEMRGGNKSWVFHEMEERNELKTVPVFSAPLDSLHLSHNACSLESPNTTLSCYLSKPFPTFCQIYPTDPSVGLNYFFMNTKPELFLYLIFIVTFCGLLL